MPVREKGPRSTVRSLRVPSHVPSHPRTAAKVRGFSRTSLGVSAETDGLREEAGFELSVPRDTTKVSRPPHVAFSDCR
jgi:hypothetical protein